MERSPLLAAIGIAPSVRPRHGSVGSRPESGNFFRPLTSMLCSVSSSHPLCRPGRWTRVRTHALDTRVRSILLTRESPQESLPWQVREWIEAGLCSKTFAFCRPDPAPGRAQVLHRVRAEVTSARMGRLRQSALRRPPTSTALSRPLYPSRRHLQSSIDRIRRQQRHVPLEGLRSRKRATHHDHFGRGVHPPVPAARAPKGLCPYPALWLHGELSAFLFIRTLPPTAGNGATFSSFRSDFDQVGMAVSHLSSANDSRREIDRGPDCVEICFEMFFRYIVGETANPRTPGMPLHVGADVCPHGASYPKFGSVLPSFIQESHCECTHTAHRLRLSVLGTPHPVTPSTREILLSP